MSFLRSATRLIVLAAAGLALSGISGCETSGADAILGAQDYYDALIRSDGSAACGHLTGRARAVLVASLDEECRQAVVSIAPPRAFLLGVKVNNAIVRGTEATVDVIPLGQDPADPLRTRLFFVGGVWRMADAYSPNGPPIASRVPRPGAK